MEDILAKLNPSQKVAVTTTKGPVLIIAGAGSGKTRALTHRVAYLIKIKNIHPQHILAVTFTNKAAGEMKERITELLTDTNEKPARIATRSVAGGQMAANKYTLPIVGTFHSICVRILRREIEKIGYKSSFNIYDTQDQLALMKKTMKELEINTDQFKPQAILSAISKAKNELVDAEIFSGSVGGYWEEVVSKIYFAYQKKLKSLEALDFDDIILLTVKIFTTYPEVLEKYQNFFRYIMVDEYQDTNRAQYTLIKLLSQKNRNLCVVGDDWQGIYSWRGADIQNILDFEKDYPDATVIKLEQNYRSTQTILDAAYGVISKNIHRKDKKIWTENGGGHLITSFEADNERGEAEFIVHEIENLQRYESFKFSDFVVLYRTNAQSRVIEEAMLRASFPYRIIGGVKFYQRKEIKDIIVYLRLVQNFNDEVSLARIINEPKRGIGEKTLEKWIGIAKNSNTDLISAGLEFSKNKILNTEHKIINSKIDSIIKFSDFIRRMSEAKNKLSLTDFIQKIYTESGYEKYLLDGTEIGEARHENVQELLTVAKKYEDLEGEDGLRLFLEEVALIADTDNIDQKTEAVHLMTLHSAKGLEFKIVFIAGLEEGILPHSKSIFDKSQLEEERRLMYVGITRAKVKVYLLFVSERNIFGSTQINAPSRFLDDIPEHLLESHNIEHGKWNKNTNTDNKNIEEATDVPCSMFHVPCFKDGDHVRHEIFGDGMIVSTQEDILTVAFKKAGLKKLSAKIAPLKKI
jgi:DNA helicase-2/ATP-dependent DNA helicase PcrA